MAHSPEAAFALASALAKFGAVTNARAILDESSAQLELHPDARNEALLSKTARELGRDVTVAEVTPLAADAVVRALDGVLAVSAHDIAGVASTA